MARTCIFCGRGSVSAEHVWPRWLAGSAGVFPGEGTLQVRRGRGGAGETFHQDWITKSLRQTVREVCAPCNNGWLSELESRAQSSLAPLLRGECPPLKREDQGVVSLWAVKTALVVERTYSNENRAISGLEAAVLFRDRCPPHGVWVYLARMDEGHGVWHRSWRLPRLVPPGFDGDRVTNDYAATFSLGRLVLQVIGIRDSDSVGVAPGLELSSIAQVWPSIREEMQLPTVTLDHAARESLARAWASTDRETFLARFSADSGSRDPSESGTPIHALPEPSRFTDGQQR